MNPNDIDGQCLTCLGELISWDVSVFSLYSQYTLADVCGVIEFCSIFSRGILH